MYVAGFPCQPFSSLGRREGYSDQRYGGLVFHIVDHIKCARPTTFILENVKNFVFVNNGECLKMLISALSEIQDSTGKTVYDVSYKVLKAASFGMPQSRNRLYIMGVPSGSQPIQITGYQAMRPISEFLDKKLPSDDPCAGRLLSQLAGQSTG